MSRTSACWLLVLGVLPAALTAQEGRRGIREVVGPRRDGFWVMAGLGAGGESYRLRGDDAGYVDALYKPTITLKVGGTLGENVRLGVELFTWIDAHDDVVESVSSLQLVAQVYPSRDAGFFLKGGAGVGRSGLDASDGFTSADVGFAASVGVGWEVPVGRNIFIVPTVDLQHHVYQGRGFTDYEERVLNFGMAIAFQSP